MSSLLLMNSLDIARALGQCPMQARPIDVCEFLKREFRNSGGGLFNYNPAIGALPDLFMGHSTLEQAIEHCRTAGAPAGRLANASAIEIAGSFAASERSNCYRIPFSAVPIGRISGDRTAYMAIKAPIVRVRMPDVFVVIPGFRLGHRPEGLEIDVAASLALATFARDDFEEADYEYLDASRGVSGERELKVYHGKERRIFDLNEVDYLLEIFVRGLSMAMDSGMPTNAPSLRGYKVIDPDQPRMI